MIKAKTSHSHLQCKRINIVCSSSISSIRLWHTSKHWHNSGKSATKYKLHSKWTQQQ